MSAVPEAGGNPDASTIHPSLSMTLMNAFESLFLNASHAWCSVASSLEATSPPLASDLAFSVFSAGAFSSAARASATADTSINAKSGILQLIFMVSLLVLSAPGLVARGRGEHGTARHTISIVSAWGVRTVPRRHFYGGRTPA